MSLKHNETRIARYSEFIAAGLLAFIIIGAFAVILLACWFIGAVALGLVWIPLGLMLVLWGQVRARAISVDFSDRITVRTLWQTVTYEEIAAWNWYDNNDLHLHFRTPTLHSWRIRAKWKQVKEAQRWLRPELWDIAPVVDDFDLSEQELRAFRSAAYQKCEERHKA